MHLCISSQKLLPRGILSFQSTRKIIFFILFFSVYAEFGQIIANALDPENLEGGEVQQGGHIANALVADLEDDTELSR